MVREVVAKMPGAAPVALDLQDALPRRPLDRTRIRLLVRNLLDNAMRHSTDSVRPPEVLLRLQGESLLLQVRDFGPGVAEEQLRHLAQPFYRTDEARTRATGGVGLGLYLCRLIAQAHAGSLTVRNAQPGLEVSVLLN
jgi:signal transduction histidine kinase